MSEPRSSLATELLDLEYREVGGWLMFFCFNLVVIGPLYSAWTIWRDLAQSPLSDQWIENTFRLSLYGVQGTITALGVVAGILLWRIHRRGLQFAKFYLLLYFLAAAAIAILLAALGSFSGNGGLICNALLPGLVRSSLFCGIWWLYLSRSYRVKRTYELKFRDRAHG